MDKAIFVQNVKKYCAKNGIKPTVACRESGAGVNLISQMENRGTVPSIERVQLLAEYLGVTVSDLLGEKKEPIPVSGDGRTREFIELFSMLTATEQALVIAQIKGILSGK